MKTIKSILQSLNLVLLSRVISLLLYGCDKKAITNTDDNPPEISDYPIVVTSQTTFFDTFSR